MAQLKDILYKVGLVEIIGDTSAEVSSITSDSRKVQKGELFVALSGGVYDGHDFIADVIKAGAKIVVCEILPEDKVAGVVYVKVSDSRDALGFIASNFYGNPSSEIKLIGVTGTNGKTTIATLLFDLFTLLGYKNGLLSTVVNKIGKENIPSTHTTPDPIQLNSLLRDMVDGGCEYCFMEVSSHAVDQKRVAGLEFRGGVFTNISHDHLDYHKTFDNYIKAKKAFFDMLPSTAFALTNSDHKNGMVMMQNTKAKVSTYAVKSMADFKAKILENEFSGLLLNINGNEAWVKLIGSFNAYNLLSVYGVSQLMEVDSMEALTALSQLNSVEGRFQFVKNEDDKVGIVDYAHTPDALLNVLNTIKDVRTGNEQVITLVGCGGNRDKDKRPVMARIACENSNRVILTSDNPRNEEPDEIISDMKKGVTPDASSRVLSIANRGEAIKTACALAQPGDIILVAGKGHEKYQDIRGEKLPFDDMKELKEALNINESNKID